MKILRATKPNLIVAIAVEQQLYQPQHIVKLQNRLTRDGHFSRFEL